MVRRSTLLVVALTSWVMARPSVPHAWGEMPPVAAAATQTVEVQLQEQTYQPPLIRVRPGDTILFRNRDPYVHAVTLIHHEDTLDQGFIEPLQTLTFVVPKDLPAGEYPLGCNIHINMRGTIIVGPGP